MWITFLATKPESLPRELHVLCITGLFLNRLRINSACDLLRNSSSCTLIFRGSHSSLRIGSVHIIFKQRSVKQRLKIRLTTTKI